MTRFYLAICDLTIAEHPVLGVFLDCSTRRTEEKKRENFEQHYLKRPRPCRVPVESGENACKHTQCNRGHSITEPVQKKLP